MPGRALLMAIAFLPLGIGKGPCVAEEPPLSVVSVLTDHEALDRPHDVELAGDLAFVAGKGGSLAIVDVADPAHPRLVWSRHDPERLSDAETVLPCGDRLFLGTCDFFSIDVADPRSPEFETCLSLRPQISRINGMVRRGDRIVAANKDGWIDVFDVSRPGRPKLFGSLDVRTRFDVGWPHDVDLYQDWGVVPDPRRFGRGGEPGKLAVLRAFSDRHELLPIDQWTLAGVVQSRELAGANRVQVSGRFAFVAGSDSEVHSHFVVVDLSNPCRPRQVTSLEFSALGGPNGLTVAGSVVFLAGGQTVEAVDVSRPAEPVKLASERLSEALPTGQDNAHDLVYRAGYLYVTGQNDDRLVILRVQSDAIRRLAEQSPPRESQRAAASDPNPRSPD